MNILDLPKCVDLPFVKVNKLKMFFLKILAKSYIIESNIKNDILYSKRASRS